VKRKKGVGEMPNLNPHLLISFLDEIIELEGVY
jgi:hypothetical protein